MAASYDLLADFQARPGGVVHVVPYCVLAVIPFTNQVTFDRSRLEEKRSASFSDSHQDAVAEDDMVIISGDCTRLAVTGDKGSHVTSLTATLEPSQPYLRMIHPGDWVFAWMVNDRETAKDLIKRLRTNKQCNDFMDGLKFVGRCQAPRETFQVSPDGTRSSSYLVTANGFTEFDSQILYFPQLERRETTTGEWMHKLAIVITDILNNGQVDINLVLPKLISRFFGIGVKNGSEEVDRTPNSVYLVPQSAARILGKEEPSLPGVFTYGDLLESIIGVQQYPFSGSANSYRAFLPDVIGDGPIYPTGKKLLGLFMPYTPSFDRPIWNLLGEYLNPALNEMYTTLRVNQDGEIVPHFIVRQMPYTTEAAFALEHLDTKFLDLPRWKIDDTLVIGGNLGPSDAARFNYVHLMGTSPGVQTDATRSYVLAPPIWDEEDIKRSGLRPYSMVVNCTPEEAAQGPSEWVEHAADFLMGQHLTWNGSLTLVGIQAPICVGDNCEYRGVVYHIENVTHDAGITPSGQRQFYTTLQLSHGMSSEATMESAAALGITRPEIAQYPSLAGATGFAPDVDTILGDN